MNSSLETRNYKLKTKGGFSIIELMIVTAIVSTFSVVLILNFRASSTNQTARTQTASVVLSEIRNAQSSALSGSQYQGKSVCGYGVHYVDATSYYIYAKPVPVPNPCSSFSTRNYVASDIIVKNDALTNSNMKFNSSFQDIYFEPPNPKTYIDNDFSLGKSTAIVIQPTNQADCSQKPCTQITVFTSGQIDITN